VDQRLHEYLSEQYGQNGLNRLPNPTQPIRIDDHSQSDFFFPFCKINVQVNADGSFDLCLQHAPTDPDVLEVVAEMQGEVSGQASVKDIRIHLQATDGPCVQRLAKSIKRIISRGAHYDEKNWKWMCPRTAASLDKLAAHLKAFDRRRRNGTLPKLLPPAMVTALTVVSPSVNSKSTRKARAASLRAQIEDDDEENLFKICGVE